MPRSSKFDVEYIAKLARLKLTPRERERFSKQLADVLAHVRKLNKLDLSGIEPTFQTTGVTDVVREDKVKKERVLTQEEALSNAPDKKKGLFRIPKIL